MGIVYTNPNDLGYLPYWTRWLEPRSLMEQTALDQYFQKYVPALLNLIYEDKNYLKKTHTVRIAVSQTKLNMVYIINIFTYYIICKHLTVFNYYLF